MKSPEFAVQALPLSAPSDKPALLFPKRATVADLRRLRDRHFKEGSHEAALQVATEVAKRDPGRESFLKRGMLLREVGRHREALDVLRDALRFESGAEYQIADIHFHIAHTWLVLGNRKRMGESVRRAYGLRMKPRSAYNFHIVHGNFLLLRKDFRGALREYLQAEKVAPNSMARGRAAGNQGIALMRQWDYEAAQGPLNRALRIHKKGGHASDLAVARAIRASIHGELNQYRRALRMFLHAAATFRRLGIVDREAEVLSNAAFHAGALGLWTKSRVIADRAISLASATGSHRILTCAYSNRALACLNTEEPELATSSVAQAQRLLRGTRDWVGQLHVLRAQARIAAYSGKWNDVFRISRRAERIASKVGDAHRVVEFRKIRAEAEERRGRAKASSYARNTAGRLEALLRSPKGRDSGKLASKLAASGMPVLLVGEGGTNKLEMARQIHQQSARAKGPCIVVPCEQLTFPASDLYGHTEGAWSGAARPSKGYVSSAQGGTIILDCLDQLPAEDQAVLAPLFDRKTRAVGGVEERILDIRVVATCTTLDALTPELRTRLEGAVIRVPSLKEQKTVIPHQVTEMIAGRRRISPDALAELARHPWDGNLAELRGVVDRLVALSEGKIGKKLIRRILKTSKNGRVGIAVHLRRASRSGALLTV